MIQQKALLLFLTLTSTLVLGFSCGPRRSANEKRYRSKEKWSRLTSDRTATITHEDIPGFMPGMTMPFKVKNDADLEMLKPGDSGHRATGRR
jgi:Cu/Ag efflux protein CusF